jgi:hypothetical protein
LPLGGSTTHTLTKPTHQRRLRATHGGKRFRIEYGGEGIGFYLYVYDGDRCTHDYLQDTITLAQDDALEMFGVPPESWADDDETA